MVQQFAFQRMHCSDAIWHPVKKHWYAVSPTKMAALFTITTKIFALKTGCRKMAVEHSQEYSVVWWLDYPRTYNIIAGKPGESRYKQLNIRKYTSIYHKWKGVNNAFKTISTLTTIKLTCPCRNVEIVQEITEKKAKNKAVLPNTPTVGFPFPIYSQKLSCRLETAVGVGQGHVPSKNGRRGSSLLCVLYLC